MKALGRTGYDYNVSDEDLLLGEGLSLEGLSTPVVLLFSLVLLLPY